MAKKKMRYELVRGYEDPKSPTVLVQDNTNGERIQVSRVQWETMKDLVLSVEPENPETVGEEPTSAATRGTGLGPEKSAYSPTPIVADESSLLAAISTKLGIPLDIVSTVIKKAQGADVPNVWNFAGYGAPESGAVDPGAWTNYVYAGVNAWNKLMTGNPDAKAYVDRALAGAGAGTEIPGNEGGDVFDLTGGGGGVGGDTGGAYGPSAYYDYLRAQENPETFGYGDYMNFLRAQLSPGGPGTAGEFYGAVQSQMSPLSNLGGGIWDFLTKMISPQTEMPSEYWSQLGKGVMPIETSLPGGYFSMIAQMFPDMLAAGTPPPPETFGALQSEAQSAVPFLANMLQGNPELAMQVVQALIGMQQSAGEPYFPYLFGPAAQGMFGGGGAAAAPEDDEVIDLR